MVDALQAERDAASGLMEFERAAEIHTRLAKAEAVAAEVAEAVRALAHLDGVIVQASAEAEHVELFLLQRGSLRGPVLFSVVGIRHPNEAAGSSSLFAQPVPNREAVPIEGSVVTQATRDELEQRLEEALAKLMPAEARRGARWKHRSGELADYLCLFSRWYYRPQAKRAGEIVFAGEDGKAPAKAVLRAVSRVWVKSRQQGQPVPGSASSQLAAG
jgi:excinuclease UvrABC nuclease subunit